MPDLFGGLVPDPQQQEGTEPSRRRRGSVPRLPAEIWHQLLACEETASAYADATYRRGEDQCWPWCSALSDSGHGKLKAGRATGGAAGRTVSAHVYGYQLHHQRLISPTLAVPDPVVAHACDEPSCQNPYHWNLMSRAENLRDFHRRKGAWPLNDVRTGPGRRSARAEALREAVRGAWAARDQVRALRRRGEPVPAELEAAADVEAAFHRASEAGRPEEPLRLF